VFAARLRRVWTSIAERGRKLLRLPQRSGSPSGIEALALDLASEPGEATNMARANAIIQRYGSVAKEQRELFHLFLAQNFLPDPTRLKAAAEAYLAIPSPETVAELTFASEPPRRELIRRMNIAPGATALLVGMRETLLSEIRKQPELRPLEQDLHHLLTSWFNRGFLELRRIDWNTSAAVLEKVIAYEAVHEIRGWNDLRRRLAPDRRCFAFFHPSLPDEPLIFVEVALCQGLASKIDPLLSVKTPEDDFARPDTAIFYSISNCQPGLRGISFGNLLIKQVVEELRAELPGLKRFATLSPIPSFRRWLNEQVAANGESVILPEERMAMSNRASVGNAKSPTTFLDIDQDKAEHLDGAVKAALQRLLATYLTAANAGKGPEDPVARFHLGNGARLDRINWGANLSDRGMAESMGMMVNYVYEPDMIESNHEQFVTEGRVAYSTEVGDLLLKRKLRGAYARASVREPQAIDTR
jgi:malonyl-CoA decarboxylase